MEDNKENAPTTNRLPRPSATSYNKLVLENRELVQHLHEVTPRCLLFRRCAAPKHLARCAYGALGGLVAARRSAHATGDVPVEKCSLSEPKGGKSVENGEKRLLLEQKGEIQQKEIEFHRISSKFGQIRLKRQLLEDGRTDGRKITQLRA